MADSHGSSVGRHPLAPARRGTDNRVLVVLTALAFILSCSLALTAHAEVADTVHSAARTEAADPAGQVDGTDVSDGSTEVVEARRVNRSSLSRMLESSHAPPLSERAWRNLGVDVEEALLDVAADRRRIFGARVRALHALGELRSEKGRRLLIDLVDSESAHPHLRAAAIEALAKGWGAEVARKRAVRMMEDSDDAVRHGARRALLHLDGARH